MGWHLKPLFLDSLDHIKQTRFLILLLQFEIWSGNIRTLDASEVA